MSGEVCSPVAGEIVKPGLCIALVGHRGRMGAMLKGHWESAGLRVCGVDREEEETSASPESNLIRPEPLRAAVEEASVVVLSVPALVLPWLMNDLGSFLKNGQVLTDITSVKIHPMRQMESRYAGPVVGTHPLFGPLPSKDDLVTAITPGAKAAEEHIRLVESLFTVFGCKTFRTTAEEHDRGAAYVQGLNFVSSAAYLASLAQRDDLMPFLTPSFRRRLESAKKLLTEDADMFQGFTSANPLTADAIHTFRLFLDLVEGGGLPDVVRRARWWYEGEGKK